MEITDFTIKEMLRLLEQMPRRANFLRDQLVRETDESNKTVFDIDKVFGNQLVARYSSRDGDMNQAGKDGFNTMHLVAPYATEQTAVKPSDVNIRLAGNTIYSDPALFLAKYVERTMYDLESRFDRLEELQLAQALQTGKVTVVGKDVSYDIDFEQKSDHILDTADVTALGGLWSDPDTDIGSQCGEICEMIEDTGAPAPTMIICGRKAANAVYKNTGFRADLDNKRIENGNINFRRINDQRATWIGRYSGVGFALDIVSYYATYDTVIGGTKTTLPYVDPWNVIFCSPGAADVRMHYAKIESFNASDFIGKRLPNQYNSKDGRQLFISMESAPMIGLHQTDAFVCATVGEDPA